jgi:hypothetical protein
MDNDMILDEIRKYCDPYSILVIADRKLMRVRCPFRVIVLIEFAGWNKGDIVYVEKIMVTRELQMVYIIGGNGYHFYLFQISLP